MKSMLDLPPTMKIQTETSPLWSGAHPANSSGSEIGCRCDRGGHACPGCLKVTTSKAQAAAIFGETKTED